MGRLLKTFLDKDLNCADMMNISDNGLKLIKYFEGTRLVAYQDVKGIWTIGTGHTADVRPNMVITDDQAMAYLRQDVQWAEQVVNREVTVDLNQNQFDALVCFVFNVGSGNFCKSTLLRKLNSGDYDGASEQFLAWDKAGGVVVSGLLRRRTAEQDLFES
jgi:lysozyme